MDGILNINKSWGPTSFDIVAKIKRLSGERRVGHAGTLDPAASGVLPVCLGQGTRVIEFLVDTTKSYRAEIELGVATDTYDATGKITQTGDPAGISWEQLDSALSSFRGSIRQVPPLYSALKRQGKPLYELARAGISVEIESRPVTIYSLEIRDWQPPVVTVEVVCSKGTYIRSLAHDLGQLLECGANLKSLIRLRCGRFDIKDAVSLTQLEAAFRHDYWQQFVYPIDSVLLHWTAIVVSDEARQDIKNGRPLVLESLGRNQADSNLKQPPSDGSSPENHCRAYAIDGSFLGILRYNPEKGQWHPQKVFM
ncbi:MAG: tRNA pseudouridine(55) synthase TruB [Dehalococcoidales bacterium]